ncbi:MAG: anaerobic ribonucleoside-triphosphate reductase [Anaerovibrio sp.]|nr:anaerobic ribonucleoside-triphosphate reductase [Anaerovibrio sp.]
MNVNGINVTVTGFNDMTEKEIIGYIEMLQNENQEELAQLTISPADDGEINLDYELQPAKFERIRRITGYLVGTIDRWNNAKRAEEHDRVKHGLN